MDQLQTRGDLLTDSVIQFFKNDNHLQQLLSIVNSECSLSLRVLDTFVTKTSKTSNTFYLLKDQSVFRVHNSYKSQLKAYSKKQFDPFNRGKRLKLFYNDGKEILITTVGQLNFFRWAIDHELIGYLNGKINESKSCDFEVEFQ